MIGLDTNVLIRAFVVENGDQTRSAREFIARRCSAADPGHVNSIVLVEAIWVLGAFYGYSRSAIADAISRLLSTDDIIIEHRELVQKVLDDYSSHSASFSDALIGEINLARGCEATGTFDRKAAKLDGFVLVK